MQKIQSISQYTQLLSSFSTQGCELARRVCRSAQRSLAQNKHAAQLMGAALTAGIVLLCVNSLHQWINDPMRKLAAELKQLQASHDELPESEIEAVYMRLGELAESLATCHADPRYKERAERLIPLANAQRRALAERASKPILDALNRLPKCYDLVAVEIESASTALPLDRLPGALDQVIHEQSAKDREELARWSELLWMDGAARERYRGTLARTSSDALNKTRNALDRARSQYRQLVADLCPDLESWSSDELPAQIDKTHINYGALHRFSSYIWGLAQQVEQLQEDLEQPFRGLDMARAKLWQENKRSQADIDSLRAKLPKKTSDKGIPADYGSKWITPALAALESRQNQALRCEDWLLTLPAGRTD